MMEKYSLLCQWDYSKNKSVDFIIDDIRVKCELFVLLHKQTSSRFLSDSYACPLTVMNERGAWVRLEVETTSHTEQRKY